MNLVKKILMYYRGSREQTGNSREKVENLSMMCIDPDDFGLKISNE